MPATNANNIAWISVNTGLLLLTTAGIITMYFESELAAARWKVHCNGIFGERSITELLCQDTDPIFFPNVRELLCILHGGTSYWQCRSGEVIFLPTTDTFMANESLGNLGVLGIHGFDFPLSVDQICQSFTQIHHRKLYSESVYGYE